MLETTSNPVVAHNQASALIWNAGGHGYDQVSFAISDALAHAAQRLAPKPGAHVLDCATGTGWTARNTARMGAKTTAIDIAPDLLSAARSLSAGVSSAIDYQLADVEDLPFKDAMFDGVISTFGAMFAADHHQAASEMARVCRKGGRLVLATWVPDSAVAEFFALIGKHSKAAPSQDPQPAASPLDWGKPDHLQALLGDYFELTFEAGVNHAYHESPEAIWQWYLEGFGPLRQVHDNLDRKGRQALKRDVDEYHEHYKVEAGLCVARKYLVTIGHRK